MGGWELVHGDVLESKRMWKGSVCVRVRVCVRICLCTCMWRPEMTWNVFFSHTPTYFFESRSFTKPGAHWFSKIGQLGPVILSFLPFLCWDYRGNATPWGLNSAPHACAASTAQTEPSLQSWEQNFYSFWSRQANNGWCRGLLSPTSH